MSKQANPLPQDGVPGKLTGEQHGKLKEMWRVFLEDLVDKAPEEGSGGKKESKDEEPFDEKKAQKETPKNDAEREKQKAEQERRDAELALKEYGRKTFMAAFWRLIAMDDPDGIMLRFLRARKWSTGAGCSMLAACIRWRLSSDCEKIFEKGEEGMRNADGFIMQMDSGKTYTQGTDKHGRPVVYIHVKLHRTSDQSPKALEDFVVFQMESVRCLLAPPVDKITMVFDMTGFGLKNMDWRCILFIVKCLEAYYPESLNVMLIHNAPWVFQGIWKLLAPMLDPVVRAKVEMTKSTEDLCVHIDKKHLVKKLGGENDWEWKYPPIEEGENEKMKDSSARKKAQKQRDAFTSEFLELTRKWIEDDSEENTKKRRACMLRMRAQYFDLDQYIRGRGAYHRAGNVVGNGLVSFQYDNVKGVGDEFECRGYEFCREQAILEAEQLERELGIESLGKGGDGGDEDEEDEDAGEKKSRRRKSKSKK